MNNFAVAQVRSFDEALAALADDRFHEPMLKAGGLDVLDHLKEGLAAPDLLVNIKTIRRTGVAENIAREGEQLRLEATTTLAEIASSELFRREAPVVAQSLADAASPAVRNVGTAAGNLLQRPRCWYYRNDEFHCRKKGGDRCFAKDGENKFHAIFETLAPCVIVHPSNLAPALMVCDATLHVAGGDREAIPLADFFHLPAVDVSSENMLLPGEVVTHITFTPRPKSGFYMVKEKQSFDWPMALAAAALELDGETIRSARLCAGAVAPVPWPLTEVARRLEGVKLGDDNALRRACARAVHDAEPLSQNEYKAALLPVVVRRAILKAAGRGEEANA